MTRFSLPATELGKVRLILLVFAVGILPVNIGRLHEAANPEPGLVGLAALANIAIGFMLIGTFWLGRLPGFWEAPALAAASVLTVLPMHDVQYLVGTCGVIAGAQALYGSQASMLLRGALLCLTLPVSVALMAWGSAPVVGVGPTVVAIGPAVLAFSLTMRMLYTILVRLKQAHDRERFLGHVSTRLVGVIDHAQIDAVMHEAVDELATLNPGLVVLRLEAPTTGAAVRTLAGHGLEVPFAAQELPSSLFVHVLDPDDEADAFIPVPSATEVLAHAGLPRRTWFAKAYGAEAGQAAELELYGVPVGWSARLLGIQGRPRTELLDAVRVLASQSRIALDSVRMHAELERMAHYDELTDLPNRGVLYRAIGQIGADVTNEYPLAVLVVDLDDFKNVNDLRGHSAGDAVLADVAHRIAQAVGDRGLTARLGGDEFAVLLPHVQDEHDALSVALDVCERLTLPTDLDGEPVEVGASVGVALAWPGDFGADELMRRADVAMYAAKAGGKGCVQLYRTDVAAGVVSEAQSISVTSL